MAKTICDTSKNHLDNHNENEEDRVEVLHNKSKVNKLRDESERLEDILSQEYSKGQFIDESVINQIINKLYGKNSERRRNSTASFNWWSKNKH